MAVSKYDCVTAEDLQALRSVRERQVKAAERRLARLALEEPDTMEELKALQADEKRWKERMKRRHKRLQEVDAFLDKLLEALKGRQPAAAAADAEEGEDGAAAAADAADANDDIEMADPSVDAAASETETEDDAPKSFCAGRQILPGSTRVRSIGGSIEAIFLSKKATVLADDTIITPLQLTRLTAPLVATKWWRHLEYLGADGLWHSMAHMEA